MPGIRTLQEGIMSPFDGQAIMPERSGDQIDGQLAFDLAAAGLRGKREPGQLTDIVVPQEWSPPAEPSKPPISNKILGTVRAMLRREI